MQCFFYRYNIVVGLHSEYDPPHTPHPMLLLVLVVEHCIPLSSWCCVFGVIGDRCTGGAESGSVLIWNGCTRQWYGVECC